MANELRDRGTLAGADPSLDFHSTGKN